MTLELVFQQRCFTLELFLKTLFHFGVHLQSDSPLEFMFLMSVVHSCMDVF